MPTIMESQFVGPLGLWYWPFLNAVLSAMAGSRGHRSRSPPSRPRSASYENIEEWELVKDEKGRLEKIVVHRSAKEVE